MKTGFGVADCSLYAIILYAASVPAQARTDIEIPAPQNELKSEQGTDIIVTGLKRDVKLIDVPVSVTVFDAANIQNAGIKQPTDFLQLTPNVNFSSLLNKGDFQVSVRGQSSVRGAEPTVAVIIDGAKIGTSAEFNGTLFDLEQIEVLKGPQGAIYGRNASSGAIIITTKMPTEEFTGSAMASYGEYNSYDMVLGVSGALIPDALRARLSASVTGDDGSYTNAVTGEKSLRYHEKSARLRLTWDTGSPFTADFRLTGIYGTGGAFASTPKVGTGLDGTPGTVLVHDYPITDIGANTNLRIPYVSDVPGRYRRRIVSSALTMRYDLGFATLASITGYSHSRELYGGKNFPFSNPADGLTNYQGWDGVFGDKTQNVRRQVNQIQEDIRLTSNGRHFIDWQVGFEFTRTRQLFGTWNSLNGALPTSLLATYAADASALTNFGGYVNGQRVLVGGGTTVSWPLTLQPLTSAYPTTNVYDSRFTNHNYGPYANATVHILPQLELILAARYDIETRNAGSIGPAEPNPFLGGASYNLCVRSTGRTVADCIAGDKATFRQLQPKATLNYRLDGVGTLYASWGRSFKSGGFNPIGTRAGSVVARATLNQASDPSLSGAAALALAETQVTVQDTYKKEVATTYETGFKIDLFDRRLFLSGAAFLTDIRNGQLFVFDPISNLETIQSIDKERVKGLEIAATLQVNRSVQLFGSYGYVDPTIKQFAADPTVRGNRPPYVALNSLNIGTQVTHALSDTKSLLARLEYNHTGTTYHSIDNDNDLRRAPYGIVNARLGFSNGPWTITAYSRNLFNKRYVTESVSIITGQISAVGLAPLRQSGVEFRTNF